MAERGSGGGGGGNIWFGLVWFVMVSVVGPQEDAGQSETELKPDSIFFCVPI